MRRKGKWGEFSKERLKVSKDVSIKWSYLLLARERGEASPSTKLSSCAFNSGQSGQEASQRETWERRIEDRNYFRFIDEPIILHLWRSCLKFYFEFVCSQFSSFHPSPIVFRGFFRKRFVLASSRCIPGNKIHGIFHSSSLRSREYPPTQDNQTLAYIFG